MAFIQEYGYSSIDVKSALMTLVSITLIESFLLYHCLILSIVGLLTAEVKITIAGPEPVIPAALPPFTNASFVNLLPIGSFKAPTTPLPFQVNATRSLPSCNAFSA